VRRGDLATVALQGDYGKPRPCLIVQADEFVEHVSVTVLPLSTHLQVAGFRIDVSPTAENGLLAPSQIMVDRAATYPRRKIGRVIGRLDPGLLPIVDQALAIWLGLPLRL
jgi:mRNA interferase MazF